jgi:hypothetical protein
MLIASSRLGADFLSAKVRDCGLMAWSGGI